MTPLTPLARVAGGAFLVGLLAGVAALVVAAAFSGVADGADTTLLFGALFFGVGLLGRSWSARTGADARREMTRVGGFGAGVMVAAATLGAVLARFM
ncbi:hypothetical protein [Halogeometricum luteum]|uniref:Uncharacterized protein n=1 Tax=Halogeometricum luteum TaxID=2950537 RepID=A0ABU2FZB6_9EURY|nr:hypothetical protein [Halogeometricum sp. S3BR5-2]MDS0293881.1 hypothetical protein [Halogeometricum sp. S3BR5-2]